MSPKLPRITARELLRALRQDGWEVLRHDGSHLQLKHPSKAGLVTVALHAGAIIKPKVLTSVLSQAGLTVEDLRRLL